MGNAKWSRLPSGQALRLAGSSTTSTEETLSVDPAYSHAGFCLRRWYRTFHFQEAPNLNPKPTSVLKEGQTTT